MPGKERASVHPAMALPPNPHSLPPERVMELLGSAAGGLPESAVEERRRRFGPNRLEEERTSHAVLFLNQFRSLLVYALVIAAAFTAAFADWADFSIIVFLLLVNALIGFYQEVRAEASIAALRKLTESKARTRRAGQERDVPSTELVPGDIVLVHEGSLVPADLRLVESTGLMVDESTITGESLPADKDAGSLLPEKAMPYELANMLLSGTTVVRGSAAAVVTATGRDTYLALLAEEAQRESPPTPLARALKGFMRRYLALVLTLVVAVGVAGALQERGLREMVKLTISQIVSAVPEGLPIVVTLVTVTGALALARRRTLIRHLPSAETIGSATVIAFDKTGTITRGHLEVEEHRALDERALRLCAALCNDSHDGRGDPVDVALAEWVGGDLGRLRSEHPRAWSFPFDTRLRMMAVSADVDGRRTLLVKGALEELGRRARDGPAAKLLEEAALGMAAKGLRVLAFARGTGEGRPPEEWELELLGIVGFLDPPKPGVREAISTVRNSGVRLIMATGDHPETARAVAAAVGIFRDGDTLVTGQEMEKMDEPALASALERATVLARIIPEHKYRIVKALQSSGQIVAMTGDGVNDVPALKAADLGIAMGGGTEAAKSVSKMVIADNDLSVIVQAVRVGRVIADNLRKTIYYLLSTNLHLLFYIMFSVLLGLPLPLLAIQILWINLVTDGVQDKTFPFIAEEGDVMCRSPRSPLRQFFDADQLSRILVFGLGMGVLSTVVFWYLVEVYSYTLAVGISFCATAAPQWFNGMQAQKQHEPFFMNLRRSLRINPYIFVGAGAGLALQLLAIYAVPSWFGCVPLEASHWLVVALLSLVAFFLVESMKWFRLAFVPAGEREKYCLMVR